MGIYTKKPSPSREHRNVHQKGQKKTSKHAFLMIHHQHLMVCLQFFPSFSFCLLLSTFCQISSAGPSCGLCLAFRLQYSPKARASSIIFLCVSPHSRLSSALMGTKVFSVLSSQACISSSFSPSFLQRPDPCPPPPTKNSESQTFLY